ncbi:MAG TPA: monofunctional biosynthetic peptidoglycan transglycosylase [Hyphomicrobiaceae bacterium]|nr:monofunctional biosynthetic peptidoglycan transglycosylase [Hyphomicrobiaceae bacterium]
MDERAQHLEPSLVGCDRPDEPPEPPAAIARREGGDEKETAACRSASPFLPRAAGGGASGVAAEVILAAALVQEAEAGLAAPTHEASQTEVAAPTAAAPVPSRLRSDEGLAEPAPPPPPELPDAEVAPTVPQPTAPAPEADRAAAPVDLPASHAAVPPWPAGDPPASAAPTSGSPLLTEIPPEMFDRPLLTPPSPQPVPALQRLEPEEAAAPRPAPRPAFRPPAASVSAAASRLPMPDAGPDLLFRTEEAPRTGGGRLRLAVRTVLAAVAALAGLVLVCAVLYRWIDPPTSMLMLGQRLTGTAIVQRWVRLERISPSLIVAVTLSEDAQFCRHRGVDWGELKEVIETAGDGPTVRGGSTITMQVVKNLFLWPSRSYLRKAIEIPLAYLVEALWSKRRILEIYLNVAEWGPGIFGAEAAARYHFRKPASQLDAREAALLAVSLPNPFERRAGRPGPGTQRLADNLLLRMRAASAAASCVRTRPIGGGG